MKITVKTNFDLRKLDAGKVNQIGLYNSAQELVDVAASLAPYQTGTLKKSISIEPKHVTRTTTRVRVGPSKVPYAVRREFENYKNPSRKFYMKKTAARAQSIVKDEFENAVRIVIASIKK